VTDPLADAEPRPYWLTQRGAPEPAEPLRAAESADLAVVGAGYSGLWTALLAKERDPDTDVVREALHRIINGVRVEIVETL